MLGPEYYYGLISVCFCDSRLIDLCSMFYCIKSESYTHLFIDIILDNFGFNYNLFYF